MAGQKEDSYRLLWMLGLALTLPMILLSGPLAGYLIGLFLIQRFGMSAALMPILMILGLVASGMQTYRLIQKLRRQSSNSKSQQ